jgi:hypothetical protein
VHNASVTDTHIEAAPGRRPSGRLVLVFAVVLVIVGLGAGWWLWSAAAAAKVDVSWTPTCTGTQVSRYESDSTGFDSLQDLDGQYVIDMQPGFSCIIHVTVHNDSGRRVELKPIDAALIGPHGGAEIVGGNAPGSATFRSSGNGIDASYPLREKLPAGESTTVDLLVTWRESGCNSGDYLWSRPWPDLELTVLGRSHVVTSGQALLLHTHDGDHIRHRGQRATC